MESVSVLNVVMVFSLMLTTRWWRQMLDEWGRSESVDDDLGLPPTPLPRLPSCLSLSLPPHTLGTCASRLATFWLALGCQVAKVTRTWPFFCFGGFVLYWLMVMWLFVLFSSVRAWVMFLDSIILFAFSLWEGIYFLCWYTNRKVWNVDEDNVKIIVDKDE